MRIQHYLLLICSLGLASLWLPACLPARGDARPAAIPKPGSSRAQWQAALAPILPPGWRVEAVRHGVAQPGGWKRTAGGAGVTVLCRNRTVTVNHRGGKGRYHPILGLDIMPKGWEGTCMDGSLMAGRFRRDVAGAQRMARIQFLPARYLGHNQLSLAGGAHVFAMGRTDGWAASDSLARHFGLAIERAP